MAESSNIADIELTGAAIARIRQSVREQGPPCAGIRLAIRQAGCSGFEYVMDYAEQPEPDDFVKHYDAFFICADSESYKLALRGLRVDYQQDALSSGFVFHNPNKTGECGCGQSFTV